MQFAQVPEYAGMRHHSMKMFSTELGINMRTGSGEAGVTHHISSSERPSHHISSSERPSHHISSSERPSHHISSSERPSHHISSSERHYQVRDVYFGKARAGGAVERRPERHQTPP
jgi:hypothetical protein